MKNLLHIRLMSVRVGRYTFSPGIFTTLVTIFFLYIMIWMAQWQSGKAEYKEKLHDSIVARKGLAPVSLAELPENRDQRLFLPVRLSGHFDPVHYFLLDNIIYKGRVGYDIYSPFHTSNGITVLINRGFYPQGESRKDLPRIKTPTGMVQIKGLLDVPPPKGFVLMKNVNKTKGWPKVLEYIDLGEIQGFLKTKVFDMVVWLDAKDPNSYTAHQPALNLNSAMNSGYAFQWYAMSVALAGIYFFVNTKRK